MLGEGEGLESSVKFAVGAMYDKFSAKWDLQVEKLKWIDLWASILTGLTVDEINQVSEHCIKEFRRPPTPSHFMILVKRIRMQQPLSDPIVSKVERIARTILTSKEFGDAKFTNSEISDACLIAAAIANSKSYDEDLPNIDRRYVHSEFSGRANMFANEVEDWKADAQEGKGYWSDILTKQ